MEVVAVFGALLAQPSSFMGGPADQPAARRRGPGRGRGHGDCCSPHGGSHDPEIAAA
jgi:hypothetical protein